MRVAFAGTPPFAACALEAIAAAGYEIPLVLTQPDRPAGRGLRMTPSAVGLVASRLELHVGKPATLKDGGAQDQLRIARADVMVVAAYGLLLPAEVLAIPAWGCLNIHASLLPRWRGAAPIHRALLAGDATTGISIMQMDAGLDTGPVLLERAWRIGAHDTTGVLTEALAKLGAEAILEVLAGLPNLGSRAQDASQATYAKKISKAEARIDWSATPVEVDRQVRAFDPAPGAETQLAGLPLKVWKCELSDARGEAGTVLQARGEHLVIACREGALRLMTVQRPGAKRISAADFLRGTDIEVGARVGGKSTLSATR